MGRSKPTEQEKWYLSGRKEGFTAGEKCVAAAVLRRIELGKGIDQVSLLCRIIVKDKYRKI